MQLTTLTRWLAILWTLIIFIGCAWPSAQLGLAGLSDKFQHLAIFALWAILWRSASRLSPLVLFGIGTLYGFLIEIYQLIMPINRSFEWLDLLADAVGILVGLALSVVLRRRLAAGK